MFENDFETLVFTKTFENDPVHEGFSKPAKMTLFTKVFQNFPKWQHFLKLRKECVELPQKQRFRDNLRK